MLSEKERWILERYEVDEQGRVYSHYSKRYLIPDVVQGYEQYTLNREGHIFRIKGHRLVGIKYIPNPYHKPHINHIDGNKRNNSVNNLEWCTPFENNLHAREKGLNPISETNSQRWECPEFRQRTGNNISRSLKESGVFKGESNPRFRYRARHKGEVVSRQQVCEITGYAQSTVDIKIRQAAQGKSIPRFIENGITVIDTKEDVQTNEKVG